MSLFRLGLPKTLPVLKYDKSCPSKCQTIGDSSLNDQVHTRFIVMVTPLHFLPSYLSPQNQREKEIEESSRKAHSAKVSHQRRQQQFKCQGLAILGKEVSSHDCSEKSVTIAEEVEPSSSYSTTNYKTDGIQAAPALSIEQSSGNERCATYGICDNFESYSCQYLRRESSTRSPAVFPGRKKLHHKKRGGKIRLTPTSTQEDGDVHAPRIAQGPARTGTNRTDAFNILSPPFASRRDMKLINHIAERLWPGFCHTFEGKFNPFSAFWLPRCVNNAALYHAILFGSCCHLASRLSLAGLEPHVKLELLSHQTRAISSLCQQIATAGNGTSDAEMEDLIMATICLATNSPNGPTKFSRDFSPFYPLLTSGHWLDTYGVLASENMHWVAVSGLIERYGGIHKVKSFGLSWVISCAALIAIAGTLSRPTYPLLNHQGQPRKLKSLAEFQLHDVWEHAYRGVGNGFRVLESLGLPKNVVDVFVSVGDLSATLDAFATGKLLDPITEEILESREVVMHKLLSLPEGAAFCSSDQSLTIEGLPDDVQFLLHFYELCRWSSLLYGVMVVFPIPRSNWAREYSISRVRAELIHLSAHPERASTAKALMWCAVIAGTLSSDEEERIWFRNRVAEVQEVLEIRTWGDAEKLMSGFGWVAHSCSAAASKFWLERPP